MQRAAKRLSDHASFAQLADPGPAYPRNTHAHLFILISALLCALVYPVCLERFAEKIQKRGWDRNLGSVRELRHQLLGYVTGIALCWFVPILVNYLIPRQES